MAVPRILLVAPFLIAGMYLPALGSDPTPAPNGVLGMTRPPLRRAPVVAPAPTKEPVG